MASQRHVRTAVLGADPPSGVQSVDRAITALEIIARDGDASVGEVAWELGVHKSTASRLLGALEERELVEVDGERGRFRLGVGLLRLAGRAVGSVDITAQARPILRDLAGDVGETVNLAVLRGHHVVNVAEAHGPAAVTASDWVGRLTPLHATASGKILLAHESPPARKRLLDAAGLPRFTSQTIVNRRGLNRELEQILALPGPARVAMTCEEYEPGLSAIAAAVSDHAGRVVAALSVSGPVYRLGVDRRAAIAADVVRAANRLSARIGHSV